MVLVRSRLGCERLLHMKWRLSPAPAGQCSEEVRLR